MWKEIPGYPLYLVSDAGEIYSIRKDRILKPSVSKFGYARVTLYRGDEKHKIMVHRLVASAFLDNPDFLEQVNHKNENKLDNRVENLEWCSCSYNINYGNRNETVSKKLKEHKMKTVARSVLQINPQTNEVVRVWDCMRDAAREMGIPHSGIYACCSGKRKTRCGYRWCYAKEGG